MRRLLFVFFESQPAVRRCEVILNIPNDIAALLASPATLSLDLSFVFTAPDVSQNLVGYDLYLQVTGGSGLSITGVGAGRRPVGHQPHLRRDGRFRQRHAVLLWGLRFVSAGTDRQRHRTVDRRGPAPGGHDRHVPGPGRT